MERKMFYGAAPDLFYKAKQLRENMTSAEKKLWEYLKENNLNFRFKAQHPIDTVYNEALTTRIRRLIDLQCFTIIDAH